MYKECFQFLLNDFYSGESLVVTNNDTSKLNCTSPLAQKLAQLKTLMQSV
jgi:hypothetical protein